MGKFKKIETSIDGVYVIEPTVFGDNRGYFMETYSKAEFEEIGLKYDFVQDNQSKSRKGVLRGLHFQKENTQAKLVRVIKGEVFDVAVDLRPGSKTYGKWETNMKTKKILSFICVIFSFFTIFAKSNLTQNQKENINLLVMMKTNQDRKSVV